MGALPHILPTLTDTMAKQENDTNDDEWLPAKAAGVCIMQLAQCCGDAIIDQIVPFITKHFTNENWYKL
jgi:importin subunit beta-1